jgi:tetratricopeptide (TPR) repeat protein
MIAAAPFLWAGYHAYAAQEAWRSYHSQEARAHFNICLHVWPWSRSPRIYRMAAQAARREGDFEEARRLLYECQNTLLDDSAEVVLEWAMLRAAMGDLDSTAEPLRLTARQQPAMRPVVCEALAEGYLVMSRILDALRATDDWLTLEPNNPQAWFVRGKIHRQIGDSQAVVTDYQRVLELDSERTEARWRLALALFDIGRYEEAAQQLAIYEQSHPNDVDVQVRWAMCLWRLGQEEEARAQLGSVLAEHPHHGLALLTRGQMALNEDRYAGAEPWLRQAAQVLPYDSKAQNAFWECLRQQGKTEEAEVQRERTESLRELRTRQWEILTRLMQQKPDDPALHCQLGTLYLRLGSPQVGEAWLLRALRLDAHYVPALEALAKLSQERGDDERAEQYHLQARIAQNHPSRGSPK